MQYIGGQLDSNGLYHLQARYYDPTIGRFTQPDPSRQDANSYAYASGDPINLLDPSGLVSAGKTKYGFYLGLNKNDQVIFRNALFSALLGAGFCAITGANPALCFFIGVAVDILYSYVKRNGVCKNGKTLYWYDVKGGSTVGCRSTKPQ